MVAVSGLAAGLVASMSLKRFRKTRISGSVRHGSMVEVMPRRAEKCCATVTRHQDEYVNG